MKTKQENKILNKRKSNQAGGKTKSMYLIHLCTSHMHTAGSHKFLGEGKEKTTKKDLNKLTLNFNGCKTMENLQNIRTSSSMQLK